ncbi:hypothetical protein GCM10023185_20360 [Hymenobacter saemangeumensis]|uniref:Nitrogen fixation protein FixH n=1 Tax=Hymenobacter saemangeumensis TaxID=1084522 RepID=A0ABP8ID79_9BACT
MSAPQKPTSFWPYAIIATFVLFAAYIGYMVQQAMRSSVDLVSADYYQQELQHQQRMSALARTAALPAPVEVSHKAEAKELALQLPVTLAAQLSSGKVQFFRPSDKALDFSVPLQPNAQGQQRLSTARLKAGLWRVRLDFEAAGQAYFVEKEISVLN